MRRALRGGRLARSLRGLLPLLALFVSCGALAAETPPRIGTRIGNGDGGVSAFYRWDGAPDGPPGRLLRSEDLPGRGSMAGAGLARRILYSSRDGLDGRPIAVSGQLFLPAGAPPAGGWPLLAWAHGTVGVGDRCAPSWSGPGARMREWFGQWLAQGYAVVATDYQGLGTPGPHPYLAKRAEARSVLDSARAAIGAGLGIGNRVVVAGQSQGGGAAFAAAAFAPDYAPELGLRGTIATGIPYLHEGTRMVSGVPPEAVDPGLAYVFYAALLAFQQDPSLDPAEIFTERALPLLAAAPEACVGELASQVAAAGLTQRNALRPGAIEALTPRLLPLFRYPTLRLAQPLMVGTGAEDRDVSAASQQALVRDACAAGTTVEAYLYRGEGHGGAWLASWPDAFRFARRVVAGEPVPPRCEAGG